MKEKSSAKIKKIHEILKENNVNLIDYNKKDLERGLILIDKDDTVKLKKAVK